MGNRRKATALAFVFWLFSTAALAYDPEKLLGAWSYVESNLHLPDGRIVQQYSKNPHGFFIFLPNGWYSHILLRDDLPRVKSGSNVTMTPNEGLALAKGTLAHYGTYTVDVAAGTFTAKVHRSSFPNFIGTSQTRRVIELSDEQLRYVNEHTNVGSGAKVHATLKRVP